MRTATVSYKGLSPFQYSRYHGTEKLEKEGHDDYEKRTWQERAHVNTDGVLFIPPMAFKRGLDDAAARLGMKIKGKGQRTYTKHFSAGVIVVNPVLLHKTAADLRRLDLFVPADGKKGGGKRVEKSFPVLDDWACEVVYHVLDDTITEEVFRLHVIEFASFIGVGTFRPQNGGYFGRMEVLSVQWT